MVKAKVETAFYDKDTDTVVWQVTLQDGRKADMILPREEFGPSIGIHCEIPAEILDFELAKFIGRDINIDIGG